MNLYGLIRPLLGCMGAETAHNLTLAALRCGLGPRRTQPPDPVLSQTLWGRDFANPLGLAAGFDKNARVIGPVLGLGFGFTEIGTVTPQAQPGNPRPRIFRLEEDEAVINRLGFNNEGMDGAAVRLARWRETAPAGAGLVGVNIGKNRDSHDAVADYAAAAKCLGGYADYLVINVSSPNTPGLRALQSADALKEIIAAVRVHAGPVPVLVKIAPDLEDNDIADILALARAGAMDGLVISNTTLARPESLKSRHREEAGD